MPEIAIRPAVQPDLPVLSSFDHGVDTAYVWQMDRQLDHGHLAINFSELRLPRRIRVEYPYQPVVLDANIIDTPGLLVAEIKGVPVGYVHVRSTQLPSTAWVRDVVVREDMRRVGIGSALVLSAQEWAHQRGLRRMVLEMQSKNFPAIQMGLKLGYDFSGYNDHYYTNQDIALFFACLIR